MGSRVREDAWQGGGWWTGRSHIPVRINQEEQLGSEIDRASKVSSARK